MSEEEETYALGLTQMLRLSGFKVDMDYMNRKLANNFKMADKMHAKYIMIIGDVEASTDIITIKNNNTKEEHKIKLEDVIDFLDQNLEEEE